MKKLFLLMYLFIFLNLLSQDIELEKLEDFGIAQTYWQRDNVLAEDGFLYALSGYGLEIYEIGDNGELTLLSRLPITVSNSIVKKNEFVYISSSKFPFDNQPGNLYQINIENKQNPMIIQEIDFNHSPFPIEIYGNVLRVKLYNTLNNYNMNYFYSLPDLYLIAQHENYLNNIDKLNETTALRFDGYNQFTVFDLTNPANPEIIGNGDVSSQHQFGIYRASIYNDSILVCTDMDIVSFWDVSNWNNWEYISQYNNHGNLMFSYKPYFQEYRMILVGHGYVELVDISNIQVPEQLDLLEGTADYIITVYLAVSDENLYLATNCNGIQRLKLIDNVLTFEDENAEYYLSRRTMQHNEFLITAPTLQSFQYFDVSNPANPTDMGDFLPTYNPFFEMSNDRIAVFQDETFDYDIFDISNIHEPAVTNQIDFDSYHTSRFDNTDSNSIYFVEQNYFHLKKYDISNSGVNELMYDEILPIDIIKWIIHNGYGYFLGFMNNGYRKLIIYEGLEINQPVLSSTIINFVENPSVQLKIIDDMLAVYTVSDMNHSSANRTKFFDISDPIMPILAFELNTFGEPFIKDDLIFTATQHCCYVFEKEENPTGLLEPFHIFYDINSIKYISFVEYNNDDYLLLSQASHIGVYSYEYTPSSAENEIPIPTFTLTNHPNPFNPETVISFELNTEITENTEIIIYNNKGQRVKQLRITYCELGINQVVWNGKDDNNKPVSSGVYMYQLKVNGKAVASRKCLLLK